VSGQDVKLNYLTRPGTATEGVDYAFTSGTLIFLAGETHKTIAVPVKGDVLHELTEIFTLGFTSISNASASGDAAHGTCTITDNDAQPTLSIDDVSVVEGNSGVTDLFFSVKLSAFSSQEIKVNWVSRAGTATAGVDFESASGTLVFPAGEISKIIKISVKADTLAESDEQLRVELNNAVNATFEKKVGVGTITDDDSVAAGAKPSYSSS
jgi:chitinase